MGRGRSSGGGGRGMSSSGGRGMSSSRGRSYSRGGSHTTVIIGGTRYYGGSGGAFNGYIFGIVICLLLAIPFLAIGFTSLNTRSKYSSVQAEAVENIKSNGWYYTVYDYTVKGEDYRNRSEEGWEFPEVEGATVTIYYLKSNPNSITEQAPPGLGSCWACIGGGVFACSLAGLLIYGYIKSKKDTKQDGEEVKDESSISPTPVDDTKIKCSYCGAKYDKKSSSCPHCGAGQK